MTNQPEETPMTNQPQLRPGREPVDMSPEAIRARQRAAVALLATRNRGWQRRRAEKRGELPLDGGDP